METPENAREQHRPHGAPGRAGPGANVGAGASADHPGDPELAARVVCARSTIDAPAEVIFALIATPSRQAEWDGNGNLGSAEASEPVSGIGEVFRVTLTKGAVRENHVVEYETDRLIAWKPATVGEAPAGHLWRWVLSPSDHGGTEVTHIYDWSGLQDERRIPRARSTTSQMLHASIARLKRLAESEVTRE